MLGWLILLVLLSAVASFIGTWLDPPRTILADGRAIIVADGDSFAIGGQKLRLDGIDAPEYRQTCRDASGAEWQCGKASRAALEKLLRLPALSCVSDASDPYGRSIATCSAARIPDLAAAQVATGMAISHEYLGIRTYGDEEDIARAAKHGLWAGEFTRPSEWRASQASK
ncbi:MAG TPA: thermonuclease family protein [Sphingorhabdus sp.]|nr:thermonuclease family protein [Sphingorhabdus sp.]